MSKRSWLLTIGAMTDLELIKGPRKNANVMFDCSGYYGQFCDPLYSVVDLYAAASNGCKKTKKQTYGERKNRKWAVS